MRISAAVGLLLLSSTLSGTTLYRVACGSVSAAADSQGNIWQSDAYFSPGSLAWSSNPGSMGVPFLTLRYAPSFSYNFQLQANTQYSVLLRFLEPNKTAAGQRLFSVSFNGIPQITGLDLFARANGAGKNFDLTFPVLTSANGQLLISFAASLGNAVISAIQIDSVPPPPPPTAPHILCKSGTISATDLNTLPAAVTNDNEFLIWSQMPGTFRFFHALITEQVMFSGFTTLTASAGRPGTDDIELTGTQIPLQVASNSTNFWFSRPSAPQLIGAFDLVIHLQSTGQPLQNATAGQLGWEICGFDTAASAATLVGLSNCSGVTSPNSNCDGMWQAAVTLPTGTSVNIIGAQMPPVSGSNWSPVSVR